jgi:hypothetical protein
MPKYEVENSFTKEYKFMTEENDTRESILIIPADDKKQLQIGFPITTVLGIGVFNPRCMTGQPKNLNAF